MADVEVEQAGDEAVDDGRDCAGSMTGVLLRAVEVAAGAEGVEQVIALSGSTMSAAELADATNWFSLADCLALFEAGVTVTGDPKIGIRAGEEVFKQYAGSEVAVLLRSLGSPGELLRNIAATGSKFSTVVHCTALEIGETDALIEYRPAEGFYRHPLLCDYSKGALAQASPLFGMQPAHVDELECAAAGAERCLYRVTWDPDSLADDADPERRIEVLERELAAMTTRFENLQATAADLVATGGVDRALAAISDRAGLAVRAPSFVLAVRVNPGEQVRVHALGVAPESLDGLVADVLDGEIDDADGSRLVVDIQSGDRWYGRFAAIYPRGSKFFPQERRLLGAYAAHAAAAIDTAAALELSQRRDRTARSLLELAQALADVASLEEVCARTVRAVVPVVGCDHANVWLWDGEGLEVRATSGEAGVLDGVRITTGDTELLAKMVEQPEPIFLGLDDDDPYVTMLLATTGSVAAAVVPISSHGSFSGVIVASVSADADRLAVDDDLVERLEGLAAITATALENARLLEQVRFQADHDGLTGLANGRLMEDRAEQALLLAKRRQGKAAVLFLDLDRFKQVNDTLGHGAGDDLLRQAAARLKAVVRASDTVARMGGDEFCILLPDVTDIDGVVTVGEKLVATLREPFQLGEERAFIGASVGVAVFPDHGQTFKQLLEPADAALYSAKSAGRGVVRQPVRSGGDESLGGLEAALITAIERDELRVHFQTVVDLTTKEVVGAEALVRWQHPELGLLTPDVFLPAAEQMGLIVDIDRWVLRLACEAAARWEREGRSARVVGVNLSARSLYATDLVDVLGEMLVSTGLSPDRLEIDVAEGVLDRGGEELQRTLAKIGALGVRLAIDDFGTGASTMAGLAQCRFHTLKIDRSVVASIVRGGTGNPMVAAMVAMARSVDMQVVAEGVETSDQVDFLRSAGCALAQGFLYRQPLDAADLDAVLGAAPSHRP